MNYARHNIQQTMYDFVIEAAKNKEFDAMVYGNRRISFKAFLKKVDNCAARLSAAGIKSGDCAAICLPNIPQAMIAFYACVRMGVIASLVHPKTSPSEFEKQIKLTSPKLVLLTEINYFLYRPYLKGIKKVFCSLVFARGFVGMRSKNSFTPYHSNGNETAVYMHSGGTTGASKTTMLSHRAFNALVDNLLFSLNISMGAQDTMLAVLPIFHGFGLAVGFHLPLIGGMPSAPVPLFSSKKIIKLIEKQNLNMLSLIPRMMQKILNDPRFTDDIAKKIRSVYVGGDNLSEKLRYDFDEKLKNAGSSCVVQQGYGLTELGSVCALNFAVPKAGSIGQPLHGIKAMIVNDNLKKVDNGRVGELIMQCDQFMNGYLNDDKTTEESFAELQGERWLKTGDYMSMDDEGFLFFKGRKKRLIKISGMNAFPLEIETAAKELKEIENCVAVQKNVDGKPYICLYTVLKEGLTLDEKLKDNLKSHLEKSLSHWSVPKYFEQITELPYTKLGKVDFREIEKMCNSTK